MELAVLATSIALQLIAAGLAVHLVWRSRALWAWAWFASALVLMAGRRMITLLGASAGRIEIDLSAELVALVISVCMVAGVGWIGPSFDRMRRTAQELRKRESELESLIDLAPEGIALVSRGYWRYVNPSLVHLLGLASSQTVEGRSVRAQLEPAAEGDFDDFVAWIDSGAPDLDGPAIRELRVRRERGVITLEVTRGPVMNYAGESVRLLLLRDVSAHRRVEEQQLEATRMEAVGRVAGGVAHDFNNLLTVILASSELARVESSLDSGGLELLEAIEKSAQRGAKLTQQLLSFARRQPTSPVTFDLNQAILAAVPLIESLLGEAISLRLGLSANPLWVCADRAQIEQVVVNLAVNSRDAMANGGTLEMTTRRSIPSERSAPLQDAVCTMDEGRARGAAVQVLEVRDTGIGMNEEVQRHIFEPFFTTKPQGKGTGLGLSMCQGIVARAGGRIEVQSAPDFGTTVRIVLPEAPSGGATQPSLDFASSMRGTERVLLVEDEALLRDVARRTLSRAGYEVLVCEDAIDAIPLLERLEGQVDLLVSDIVMPRMNGCELAAYVRVHHPAVRILLVSGYGEKVLGEVGLPADCALLPKPFTPRSLCRAVRLVLDGQPLRAEAGGLEVPFDEGAV